jgi:Acetyltransferase (GNAT) domain
MPQDLEVINPIHFPKWDERVLSAKNYSFFHSSNWAKVLHESYGYSPLYFTLIDSGSIIAAIPCMEIKSIVTGKRAVSLPFTDYCEPIMGEGWSDESFHSLVNHLIAYGRNMAWRSIELRGSIHSFEPSAPFYAFHGHVLDTSKKEDEIFSSFHDGTKRNIKKAIHEGVKVGVFDSLDSVREFYQLNCLTRKDHGLPPQPYRFFENLYEHVLSKTRGIVVLASHGGRYIAGAIYLHLGERAIYKYGASDRKYQRLRANNLVMWEAIKWLSQNGYKDLCFGRTEPENSGLKRFKDGWGTAARVIEYYNYDVSKEAFVGKSLQFNGFPKQIFSRLPQFLLKPTGAVLYKHIG